VHYNLFIWRRAMTRFKTLLTAAATGGVLAAVPAAATEDLRIEAGADQTAPLQSPVYLSGSVSKVASIGWSKVEGPGEVVFDSRHAAATTATFSQPGEYTLMLGGYDGYVAYDFVRVTVLP